MAAVKVRESCVLELISGRRIDAENGVISDTESRVSPYCYFKSYIFEIVL